MEAIERKEFEGQKRLCDERFRRDKEDVKGAEDKLSELRQLVTEMAAIKIDRDDKKGKRDKLAKVVKRLTQAEFDALPKALQKELKEFR
jgi:hypothetical protein